MTTNANRPGQTTPTITSLADLPLVLTVDHVCALVGWSYKRLLRALTRGEFPKPFAKYPMRWYRVDVERWASGEAVKPVRALRAVSR